MLFILFCYGYGLTVCVLNLSYTSCRQSPVLPHLLFLVVPPETKGWGGLVEATPHSRAVSLSGSDRGYSCLSVPLFTFELLPIPTTPEKHPIPRFGCIDQKPTSHCSLSVRSILFLTPPSLVSFLLPSPPLHLTTPSVFQYDYCDTSSQSKSLILSQPRVLVVQLHTRLLPEHAKTSSLVLERQNSGRAARVSTRNEGVRLRQ